MPHTDTSSPSLSHHFKSPTLYQDKLLLAIVAAGSFIRIAFTTYGYKLYYGAGSPHITGDSQSYTDSFLNLLQHGTYTFDFLEPEAAFGRLPGYPFFYGLHYLIFGPEKAIAAVSCSQTLLDCLAIVLVFLIARRLAPAAHRLTPYVAAALYAFYPFIVVWTTVIGTELLATFLTLLWLYTLLASNGRWPYYFLLGIEIALLFYVREFLGIYLPITLLYLIWTHRNDWQTAWRRCVLVGAAFSILYIGWPLRNYFFQHRVMLVKPVRAGFANYKEDMVSFLDWVHCWSNESTYWLQQALSVPQPPFPTDIFASAAEREQAYALLKQANDCGSSFYIYKNTSWLNYSDVAAMRKNQDYNIQCNSEIAKGFTQLKASFKQRHPVAYYTQVPFSNLQKAFFKNGKTSVSNGNDSRTVLLTLLFGYRSLLLLLGMAGLIVFRHITGLKPIMWFFIFIELFLCFYYRQLEIRYLLQSDVLMLLPAALLLGQWLQKILPTPNPSVSDI